MRSGPVLIIGGGIGGLSAALALHRVGVPVQVFERAPELSEVGAGLGLWTNALRVLDQLRVGERIRQVGFPLTVLEGCSYRGTVLSRLPLARVLGDGDAANYVVRRTDLQAVLAEQLPAGMVTTGAECVAVEQERERVTARFQDGRSVAGAVLIGADGLHSVVRKALWGDSELRYSGQTCYRALAPTMPPDPHVLREVQGPGMRGSVCAVGEGQVYWWAAMNAPPGEADDPAERKQYLLDRYRNWPFHIPEAIAATEGPILRNDLVDRPPLRRWIRGRITLLGDAAHPMLPNLGQGGCTAIEDGLVLACAIARHGTTATALASYEQERIGRATRIARQSWNFGVAVRWQAPWAVWAREQIVRLTPNAITGRIVAAQIDFDVGALAG